MIPIQLSDFSTLGYRAMNDLSGSALRVVRAGLPQRQRTGGVLLKTPRRNSMMYLVIGAPPFMQRLAVLVLPRTASRPSILAVGCPVWVDSSRPGTLGELPFSGCLGSLARR